MGEFDEEFEEVPDFDTEGEEYFDNNYLMPGQEAEKGYVGRKADEYKDYAKGYAKDKFDNSAVGQKYNQAKDYAKQKVDGAKDAVKNKVGGYADGAKQRLYNSNAGKAVRGAGQKAKQKFDNSAVGQKAKGLTNQIGKYVGLLTPSDIKFIKSLLKKFLTWKDVAKLWQILTRNPAGKKLVIKINAKVKAKLLALYGSGLIILPILYFVKPKCMTDLVGGLVEMLDDPVVIAALMGVNAITWGIKFPIIGAIPGAAGVLVVIKGWLVPVNIVLKAILLPFIAAEEARQAAKNMGKKQKQGDGLQAFDGDSTAKQIQKSTQIKHDSERIAQKQGRKLNEQGSSSPKTSAA